MYRNTPDTLTGSSEHFTQCYSAKHNTNVTYKQQLVGRWSRLLHRTIILTRLLRVFYGFSH